MPNMKKDYLSLSTRLDEILAALQRPDIHVDEAVTLYEQGLLVVDQLEETLNQAENRISQLKLKTSGKE